MLRAVEDAVGRAALDDHAVLHHEHAVAQVADDAEVVRDEEVAHARDSRCRSTSRSRICAWIETSSADTASSSTITDGPRGQRARDGDPLTLAAGEAEREPVEHRVGEADLREQLEHALAPRRRGAETLAAKGVEQDALDVPARVERAQRVLVHDGDARSRARGACARAAPTRRDRAVAPSPPSSDSSPSASRAVVLLPEPDSPTMPSVSPGCERERHPVDGARHRAVGRAEALRRGRRLQHGAGRLEHAASGAGVGRGRLCPGTGPPRSPG